jgi:hypothetical protein
VVTGRSAQTAPAARPAEDRGTGLEARFVVAPARSFLEPELLAEPNLLGERLGLIAPPRPVAATFLPAVLAATFAPPGVAEDLVERLDWPELSWAD